MDIEASKPPKITRLEPTKRRGLTLVITGDGKGKTTSAFGMALRACGHNLRVCIIQFMKGDIYAGEWDGVKKLDCAIELHVTGKGFCGFTNDAIQGKTVDIDYLRQNARVKITSTV